VERYLAAPLEAWPVAVRQRFGPGVTWGTFQLVHLKLPWASGKLNFQLAQLYGPWRAVY
jgi:hypothetical protein